MVNYLREHEDFTLAASGLVRDLIIVVRPVVSKLENGIREA